MSNPIPERYYVGEVRQRSTQTVIIPADITPEECELLEIVKQNMIYDLQDDRTRLVFMMIHLLGWSESEVSRSLGLNPSLITRQKGYIKKRLTRYRDGY